MLEMGAEGKSMLADCAVKPGAEIPTPFVDQDRSAWLGGAQGQQEVPIFSR